MRWLRASLILFVLIGGGVSSGEANTLQTADDTCADILLGSITNAGLNPATSASALACRLGSSGQWFMPKIGDLSDSTSVIGLDARGKPLLNQVDMFSTDQALVSSILFLRNDGMVLTQGPGGRTISTDVSAYDVGGGPSWLHNIQKTYNDSAIRYLQSNSNSVFSEYASWYMNRRDVSLWSITRNMNPLAGNAFLANWGFQQFPWPWQLADQAAIAEYFGASVINLPIQSGQELGRAPSPTKVSERSRTAMIWGRIEVARFYSTPTAGCRSDYFYRGLPLSLYDYNGTELATTDLGDGEVTISTVNPGIQVCVMPFVFVNAPLKPLYLLASDLNGPGGWQIATLTGILPDANGNYRITVTIS